jgi:hypothetical protein
VAVEEAEVAEEEEVEVDLVVHMLGDQHHAKINA